MKKNKIYIDLELNEPEKLDPKKLSQVKDQILAKVENALTEIVTTDTPDVNFLHLLIIK